MEEINKDLDDTLTEFDPHSLFSHGFDVGSMDIIQGGCFDDVIGRTPIALWCGLQQRVFDGILVILPPPSATALTDEAVMAALHYGVEMLTKAKPTEKAIAFLERVVNVVACPSLDAADLVNLIAAQGSKQLIAIPEIQNYRDNNLPPRPIIGLSAVLTSQDVWTQHVISICRQVMTELKNHDAYAVVHVDDSCILTDKNNEMLTSIDDCYVACLSFKNDKKELVDQHAQRWVTQIMGGLTGEVMSEVENLNLPEINRLHLLAQLYSRAGKDTETINILTLCVGHHSSWSKENLVQLASIAYKAGSKPLTETFLPKDINGLASHNWLEKALDIATDLHNNALIERYDQAMEALFTRSESLRENRDRRLLMNCRLTRMSREQLFTTAGFSQHHLSLQSEIFSDHPVYTSIVEAASSWGNEWSELAAICCCTHANSVEKPRDAADVASLITTSPLYGRQATQIVLTSLRKMMLTEDIRPEDHDYYRIPIQAVIRYLAHFPNDSDTRVRITELLSVESCGEIGIPAITLTMLDIAKEQIQGISSSQNDVSGKVGENEETEVPVDEVLMENLKRALSWLDTQRVVEYGVTVLPSGMVEHPDNLIRLIARLINYSAPEREDIDLKFMENMVSVVCALTPHAEYEVNTDLKVLRLLGGQYAAASQFQHARNFAEQALLLGLANTERKRLAWLAYADIYQRCKDPLQALYGLACAFATNGETTSADMWQEIFTATRILRDLGLLDQARDLLPSLRILLANLGFDPDCDLRMLSIEESINLSASTSTDPITLTKMMARLTEGCENACNDRSALMPLIVLLSQVVQQADNFYVDVPSETRCTLARGLEFLGEQAAEFISTVAKTVPTAEAIIRQFNLIERASYAGDVARDYSMIAVAARRLLNAQADAPRPASENALAIEILADHAVSTTSKPDPLEINWPVEYARTLNTKGAEVVFLGLDTAGELVVVHVSQQSIVRIEQPIYARSFRNRMLTWLEAYPYQYGLIDAANGNNEFFAAMESLDIQLPLATNLLVIAEPELQQLTLNLALIKTHDDDMGDFIGHRSAIGMVPSLTWLSKIRQSQRSNNHTRKAWISHQEGPDGGGTLGVALQRLEGTFDEFGFSLDTEQRLPDLSSAAISVIVAHGGLTKSGRYIHRISDEETLVETPEALANSVRYSDVVILFVCSGGRIDKNPWSNTTVGLPKLLLNKGARAVIASPWPLDVKVTYRWLQPFLTKWDEGASLFEATKAANDDIARNLGNSPQYALAMTVYGDGFLTKS
ncbi:CHAT domain-containing protein [Erwinia persicina]|uniref:CHAT domain-containing protein n=1 Tax=Erwinia persicina TaxID=55211 RepID=UPI00078931F5|nr:CHAT domain-containing protein [Erwinia persicina]